MQWPASRRAAGAVGFRRRVGNPREVLKYPVEAVDYVELDPLILDVARKSLPESLAEGEST